MQELLALDLPLGHDLEVTLRRCVELEQPFCLLDQRRSAHARALELEALAPTRVRDATGEHPRRSGRPVDDGTALVMLTSGSSGPPKAAELSWRALRASATLTQSALRTSGAPVWFPCLPPCHVGGLAVLLRAVMSDATLVWAPPDGFERAWALGATHVAVVRTQLVRHDLSRYERVLLGGARPPGDLPSNVVTTWGMTETASGVVYDARALPGVELAVLEGELCVRTPTLFTRYRDRARPSVTGPDAKRDWFPTGDGAELSHGRLKVRGRLGSVITTGGEKLWPEDLEAVLALVPGVKEVAVTGRPDPEWGQCVVALVVAAENASDEALRAAASDRLGPWAKPKEIRRVSALPRTANGKIRREALTDLVEL